LILIDWSYAVKIGEPIKALASTGDYPDEVTGKKPASTATDIFMAARTMAWVGGGDTRMAPPLRSHFRGASASGQTSRPQSAWWLLNEYTEMIEKLWGPRRFHEFTMPTPGKV
jgi:hypothetical protein